MGGVQGQAEGVVERGFGHFQVRGALNPLLGDGGQVNADGQDIDIGRHAGGAHGFGLGEVGLGAAEGLFRGGEALGREDGAVVGLDDAGNQLHAGAAFLLSGQLAGEAGGFHSVFGLAGVVEDLVHGELRLEIVEGIGAVERADIEIVNTELVLGEEGAKYEDGVIAARVGFRIVDLGQQAGACLVQAGFGGAHARAGGRDGFVFSQGELHGVTQGEGVLRE